MFLAGAEKGGNPRLDHHPPPAEKAAAHGVRQAFVFVQPDVAVLAELAKLADAGKLRPYLEMVLPLAEARRAQELSLGRPCTGEDRPEGGMSGRCEVQVEELGEMMLSLWRQGCHNIKARELSPDTYVNIMDQYRLCFKASGHPLMNRRINTGEFEEAVEIAREEGIRRLDGFAV